MRSRTLTAKRHHEFPETRPLVCIQGLGFVGVAMALAVADARNGAGKPVFNVIGVDLDSEPGRRKVKSLNAGLLPIDTVDPNIAAALDRALSTRNFHATTDNEVYRGATVVVVDIPCDVHFGETIDVDMHPLRSAVRTLGERIPQDCLVLVETTVPPGTCETIVASVLRECFQARDLPDSEILLAHSYERVMPGPEYFSSINNLWRVYSGFTEVAADRAREFLSQVVNVKEFPLTRLASTRASEMAKVLENTYRAVNIALIDEWSRFAEAVEVDLFDVLSAIRVRPTHSNIRYPGFGVGGYCLTKDPMLGVLSASRIFDAKDLEFPFSTMAVEINRKMPLAVVRRLERLWGSLKNRRLALLGVSYRAGVGDTRHSASEIFAVEAEKRGAAIVPHDPLVPYWHEMQMAISAVLPSSTGLDAAILAVDHPVYHSREVLSWLSHIAVVVDANGVLSRDERADIRRAGARVLAIGRGDSCD